MLNKTEYWLELCDDDLNVAKWLLKGKKFLHMGFYCHLITEKALKAVIANTTNDLPPKIHHLLRLAEIGEIRQELNESQVELLK